MNVYESVFYTHSHAAKYKTFFLIPSVLLIFLYLGLVISGTTPQGVGEMNRILELLVAVFLFGDFTKRFLSLEKLDGAAEEILLQGQKLLESKGVISEPTAKSFAYRYLLLKKGLEPIPSWFHDARKDHVYNAWRKEPVLALSWNQQTKSQE